MINYLIYRLGQFLVLSLPRTLSYRLAIFLSDLHYLFYPRDRQAVRNNLQQVLGEYADIEGLVRQVFRNFGMYLVDFFRMAKMGKANFRDSVTLENIEYVENELKKGKGVICVTAHLGNWELGGVAMALAGYPVLAVALEHKSALVNNFFNAQRIQQGVAVATLKSAGRKCLEALKQNHFVALVVDRDFSRNGILVELFGKKTLIPKGPAIFARRTGAAIIPGFVVRQDDHRFKVIFEKPLAARITDKEEEDILLITQDYMRVVEDYVRRYPSQWLIFREFWQ
ncbi:MAG: lysophospholipid acyltransferase family protein [Candidatus Omnitrophota bacterium]